MNVNNYLRVALLRLKRKDVRASWLSTVDGSSQIGPGPTLLRYANLVRTRIGRDVTVGTRCHLQDCQLGDYVSLGPESSLYDCRLGDFSYIASATQMSRTSVGKFCSIAAEIISCPGNHPTRAASTSPVFHTAVKLCGTTFATTEHFATRGQVEIGNDVWIGTRVVIRDGVRIGDGAIVGAGAIVVRDVPPYAIVGGVPAKLIRFRFEDATIARLLAIRWWDWPMEKLRSAQPLFLEDRVEELLTWAEKSRPAIDPATSATKTE